MTQLPQLRVAVNSRCRRACFYCRPSGEGAKTEANAELRLEHLMLVATECARRGIRSIKLTGGDPALWPPLVEAVRRLKRLGFDEVHVISRHPKIGDLATALADAKVDLINVSIDTLKPEIHHEITGVNDLPSLLSAVSQCVSSGVPTKVNMVVMGGINDDEVEAVATTMAAAGVKELKLLDVIQDLDLGSETFAARLSKLRGRSLKELYVPLDQVVQKMRSQTISEQVVNQGDLGHPMLSMRLATGLNLIVKNHTLGAWYGSICRSCTRYPCHDALMALRLTADLRLQFCLLSEDVTVDLRPVLEGGTDTLSETISAALSVYNNAWFEQSPRTVQSNSDLPLVAAS